MPPLICPRRGTPGDLWFTIKDKGIIYPTCYAELVAKVADGDAMFSSGEKRKEAK